MHYYCLHCQTQKNRQISEMLKKLAGVDVIRPQITQRKWKKGRQELVQHEYLPGYLFIYSEEPLDSFYEVSRIAGVFRILGSRENGYELTGSDLSFAKMLHDLDGVIGIMKTYREGDIVKLDKSMFSGFEGRIVRLDRRKGRAQIEFDFDDSTQRVWVGYEMIDSHSSDTSAGQNRR